MLYIPNISQQNLIPKMCNMALKQKSLHKRSKNKTKYSNKINEGDCKNIEDNKKINHESNIKKYNYPNSQNKLINGNKIYESYNNVIQKEKNSYKNNLNEVNQRSNYNCKENKYLKNDNLIINSEISNINSISCNNDFEQNIIQIILKNVGNTTYMNSCIRCFANNKIFSDYFLYNLDIFKNNMHLVPLSYLFSRIIFHLFPNPKFPFLKSYSLDKFHYAVTYLNPIFKGKSTKNAIDFLIYLIEQLQIESTKLRDLKNVIKENSQHIIDCQNYIKSLNDNEYTNVFREFAWINKTLEKCWECKNEEMTFKSFLTYDLDFESALNKTIISNKNELSILDCIEYASENKNIYNVFCNKCNKRNNFEKKSSIHSTGNSLILLNRGMEKKEIIDEIKINNIKIKINESLNLNGIIVNNKNTIYNINGLIVYDTEKLEYIAYSKNPINKKWYKYIEEKIIPVQLNDFINEFNYKKFPAIFFYRHEE